MEPRKIEIKHHKKTPEINVIDVEGNPVLVTPKNHGYNSLEPYAPAPTRKKGQYRFEELESFIAFLKKHDNDNLMIYASSQEIGVSESSITGGATNGANAVARVTRNHAVTAIFNDNAHQPGWRDFTARYDCPTAEQWQTWTQNAGKRISQVEFAEFIEENRLDILTPGEGCDNPTTTQLREMILNISNTSTLKFKSNISRRDGRIQIEYADEAKPGKLVVPEKILIGIPVFKYGTIYQVEVEFFTRFNQGGAKVDFFYKIYQRSEIEKTAFAEVVKEIKAAEFDVYFGAVQKTAKNSY